MIGYFLRISVLTKFVKAVYLSPDSLNKYPILPALNLFNFKTGVLSINNSHLSEFINLIV